MLDVSPLRQILYVAVLCCMGGLALSACGGSPPALPKLADDAVILAFGDSLTYGTGAPPEESYPTVLAALSGRRVIRSGVPGEVSEHGLKRLPNVLAEVNPDLVILCHGGNDMLRKVDARRTDRNIRAMVDLVKERGIPVVLIGVPKPGLFLSTADFYRDIAEDLNLPLENGVLADLLGDNSFKSDQIHPNARGYRRLAQAVDELLRESGAL